MKFFLKIFKMEPKKFCMHHKMNYWFFFWLSHNACIYSRLLVEWHYVTAVSGLVFYDFNFEIFSTQEVLWRAVVGFSHLFIFFILSSVAVVVSAATAACINVFFIISSIQCDTITEYIAFQFERFRSWFQKRVSLYCRLYSGMVILQNASIAPWNQDGASKKKKQ